MRELGVPPGYTSGNQCLSCPPLAVLCCAAAGAVRHYGPQGSPHLWGDHRAAGPCSEGHTYTQHRVHGERVHSRSGWAGLTGLEWVEEGASVDEWAWLGGLPVTLSL